MIYLQINLVLCLVFSIFFYQPVFCETQIQTQSNNNTKSMPSIKIITKQVFIKSKPMQRNITSGGEKNRVKRQSGAGKFSEAANVPPVKLLRLFLQGIRNFWAPVHVGGSHPMHPIVPKPVVFLFKDKIVDFFFPPITADENDEEES